MLTHPPPPLTPLRRGTSVAMAFVLGMLLAGEATASIRRGWTRYPRGRGGMGPIERRHDPEMFWSMVAVYFVFAAFFFYAAAFFLVEPGTS